jgi:hypothetical protein
VRTDVCTANAMTTTPHTTEKIGKIVLIAPVRQRHSAHRPGAPLELAS